MSDDCSEAPPCTEEDNRISFNDFEGKNAELDFGTLELFKERTKYITFSRPMIEEDIEYTIKKNTSLKSIKSNFDLDHRQGILKLNNDFKMGVTYKPTLPSVKDVEIYEYTDTDDEFIKITLSGVAIGPRCTLSAKRLDFYKTPERKIVQSKVEINNDSGATASFKIDYADIDVFHIEPLEGIVKPKGYEYITITFRPSKPGVFARKVFCLVWNSDPLVLNILGIYSRTVGMVDVTLKYFTNYDQLFGYQGYLDDSVTVRRDIPPFSMTTNYLDFGSVQIKGNQPRTQVTSITNHSNNSILVDWNRGTKPRVFKITPDSVTIRPESCMQFEVRFTPEEDYTVFHETMIAQINWDLNSSNLVVPVPLTCMLRAQGHSFPENEGWITRVEVLPEVIYLQPCAPGEKTYSTFAMRNKSHLPVLYRLVPPKKTYIIVKPMMGMFRNLEIIVVQLQTEPVKIKTYIEEWKIIINGRKDRTTTIYFRGETSLPTVEIGRNNKINAGSVQDGSQKEIDVIMKNTSYFAMSYQFQLIQNSIIKIMPMSGILPINESTKLVIKVMGSQCAPKKEKFVCEMHIIDGNGAISGNSHDLGIEIYTTCSYSELCASPSSKDFGHRAYGQRIKTDFQAANFGDTPIFFQTCQLGDENHDPNFRIKPCFGEVKPKGCKRFSITGIISQIGSQTLQFGYYNRMVKDSPLVVGDPITLFRLSYVSEFPMIQIEEIVDHNFGDLFGKSDLYRHYLEIPRVNRILREITNDETIDVQLRLPEFEIQKKEYHIIVALTNVSDFDTTMIIKRKKICDCQLQEMSAGISERVKGFNCPHRASLSLELQDTRFFAKTTRFLTIKVKYCLKNETVMCYSMQLSNNRVIELFFNIFAIPPQNPRLSWYKRKFALMLKDVYLGTRVAPVQMFWMYNNTSSLLTFEFDTLEVDHLCRINGFRVLEILNPVDQILPFHSKALLVKFHPIELKTYAINIQVKYYFPEQKEVCSMFLIEGDGVMTLENRLSSTISAIPRVCKFSSNFPVSLSLEYIEVKMLPVWSRRKELIFIKNNSRGKIIQYVWGMVKIDNVIEISTENTYSILQAKEIQPVVFTIKSFSEPCITEVLIPCEIVCYSDKVIHQITKEKNRIAENRINEFMQGEPVWSKRPVNPIDVHPNPETLFASVVINIRTIHTKDFDETIDTSLQIKQYPNQSIENIPKSLLKKYYPEEKTLKFPEKEKSHPPISVNERVIFCRVLEEVLSNVVDSNLLKHLLEKSIKTPMHKYNEFVMDDRKVMETKVSATPLSNKDIEQYRKREIEIFFNQLKITDLSTLLQTLIYEGILQLVKCHKPEFNISDLNEKLRKKLYTCKNKSCLCTKDD